jgi:hypothetical protein
MQTYFNKKQVQAMNLLLNSAEELIERSEVSKKEEFEDLMDTIQEIKSKINGTKALSKNEAIFSSIEIPCRNSEDFLIVRGRDDGRAIILESKHNKKNDKGRLTFKFEQEHLLVLTNEIIKYLNAWGIEYLAEDKAYSDEINVYADGVERSISINGGRISYICYTNDEMDDHWTFLTPRKAKCFVELMLGYINSAA